MARTIKIRGVDCYVDKNKKKTLHGEHESYSKPGRH